MCNTNLWLPIDSLQNKKKGYLTDVAYWHAFDDQVLLGVNAVHFLIGWNGFPKIYKF